MRFGERGPNCKGLARLHSVPVESAPARRGEHFLIFSPKSFKNDAQETRLQNELFLPCFARSLLTNAS